MLGINAGTIRNVYVQAENVANINVSDADFGGISGRNLGTIQNTYFAGKATFTTGSGENIGVISGTNTGTISYSYHDSTIISVGMNTTASTGITTANFRTLTGIVTSEANIFRRVRKGASSTYMYPTLYGYVGTGVELDPFLISSPATLLYFPYSYEYQVTNRFYKITNDIDMNLLAKNAYIPGEVSRTTANNVTIDGSVTGSDVGNSKYINGSYSIINLTINKPLEYIASSISYLSFGFIPVARL